MVGSEVIHDREEQVAEVWNARFRIGGVPVFYSPYLQLPVGDKRRSASLIPNAKYGSNNGFEFMLPYYWNIAELRRHHHPALYVQARLRNGRPSSVIWCSRVSA